MEIFLNALGATTASGLTYLRNALPHLRDRTDVHTTVALNTAVRPEFSQAGGVTIAEMSVPPSAAGRFWFEQTRLPAVLRRMRADVLISAGNIALRSSPVPQILLSGNSLYTSSDFYRDLRRRREYPMWLDTRLKAVFARKSVGWAGCTVAPSRAFAEELRRWSRGKVVTIHHGFDPEIFFADSSPLPKQLQQKLSIARDALRLLLVSHYNYFRNLETVFRALPIIKRKLGGKKVRLFLTCRLLNGENPGSYRCDSALSLLEQLGIRQEVVELGTLPYSALHHVYRACDVYVTASYAETFAHPLAEAMACGLRIVASDLPVHREVCGASALYFPRFSPEELAEQVLRAAALVPPPAVMTQFSWGVHVEQLVALAAEMVRSRANLNCESCDPPRNPELWPAHVDAIRCVDQRPEDMAQSP